MNAEQRYLQILGIAPVQFSIGKAQKECFLTGEGGRESLLCEVLGRVPFRQGKTHSITPGDISLPGWSFMLLQNVSCSGFMWLYLDSKRELSFSAMGTSSKYIILFHCSSRYNKLP